MAVRKKGCLGGCLGTLIGLIVILAIIVLVVINLTPNTVKLGDTVIPGIGKSCNELGLGDTKIKDVIKALQSLTKDTETLRKEIVSNPVASNTSAADEHYGDETDYSIIFSSPLTLEEEATLTDGEFGGILNAASVGLSSEVDLPEGAVAVEQVNITTNDAGEAAAEVTMSVKLDEVLNSSGMSADDIAKLDEALSKVNMDLGDSIFVTVQTPLEVQAGNVVAEGEAELLINNNPELTALVAAFTSSSDGFSVDALAASAADMLANAMNNLGGDVSLEDGSITVTP